MSREVNLATSGFLLIDKPVGPTSHDAVDALRRLTGIRKVGHAGTLDPEASGLLIVAVGPATKQIQALVGLDKTYDAEVTLGATSTTDDEEGELSPVSDREPTPQEIQTALQAFLGAHEQRPPAHSARKLGGVKGYEAARRGEALDLPTKTVTIHELTLRSYRYPTCELRTTVSSGTYIRSLARDLGESLAVGGYLSALRRTTVGPYRVEDATPLEALSRDWSQKLFKIGEA